MSATTPLLYDPHQAIAPKPEIRPAQPQDMIFTVRFTDNSGHVVRSTVLARNPSEALWLAVSDEVVQRQIQSTLATVSDPLNVIVVRT